MTSRRKIAVLMLQGLPASLIRGQPAQLNVQLSARESRELEAAGERAMREAGWLEELPLDAVPPAFVFVSR